MRNSPVCAVFASKTTIDIMRKQNNLSPAEFLRPFADVGNINNIALQTSDKNLPFKLTNFGLNFVDSQQIDGLSQQENNFIID